jgi:hypothetical protein
MCSELSSSSFLASTPAPPRDVKSALAIFEQLETLRSFKESYWELHILETQSLFCCGNTTFLGENEKLP